MSKRGLTIVTASAMLLTCALVGVLTNVVSDPDSIGLPVVTVAGVTATIALLVMAYRSAGRLLTFSWLIPALWTVYLPARLLVVTSDRDNFTLHPAVVRASDSDFITLWGIAVTGLAALVLGSHFVNRTRLRPLDIFVATPTRFVLVSVAGLATSALVLVLGGGGGALTNFGALGLFGIGGLAFLDGRSGRIRPMTVVFVAIAVGLGAMAAFKELATVPILIFGVAWTSGSGRRPSLVALAAITILGIMAFFGVEGQRMSAHVDESPSLPGAAWSALTRYDLRTGSIDSDGKSVIEIFTNAGSAVSRRVSAVEALLITRGAVPTQQPFYRGRTIVDPLVSLIPGIDRVGGSVEFSQLSLGQWYKTNYYSQSPSRDPSSQALTWPGDLYLNFGTLGILVGMFLFGLAFATIDRLVPMSTAFGCATFGYIGTTLLGLERNVAYVIGTTGLRMAILAAVLVTLQTSRRRAAARSPAVA